MTATPTTTTPTATLGTQIRQDVVAGATTVANDAVAALDLWLETHVQKGPLGQNPVLSGLITTAFTALRTLIL